MTTKSIAQPISEHCDDISAEYDNIYQNLLDLDPSDNAKLKYIWSHLGSPFERFFSVVEKLDQTVKDSKLVDCLRQSDLYDTDKSAFQAVYNECWNFLQLSNQFAYNLYKLGRHYHLHVLVIWYLIHRVPGPIFFLDKKECESLRSSYQDSFKCFE